MSHTTTRPRYRTPRPALLDPVEKVIEGTCPSRTCRAVYPLTPTGQIAEHPRANQWGATARRCPCSGWLALDPRPRQHFYVEGVRFL